MSRATMKSKAKYLAVLAIGMVIVMFAVIGVAYTFKLDHTRDFCVDSRHGECFQWITQEDAKYMVQQMWDTSVSD